MEALESSFFVESLRPVQSIVDSLGQDDKDRVTTERPCGDGLQFFLGEGSAALGCQGAGRRASQGGSTKVGAWPVPSKPPCAVLVGGVALELSGELSVSRVRRRKPRAATGVGRETLAMAVHEDTMLSAQYYTAVAGFAALRHCITRPSLVRDRLDDICRVAEALDEFPNNIEIPVSEHTVEDAYTRWASTYDDPANPAIVAEEPAMRALLEAAPPGRALDVGCGTGRHAAHLASLGYEVTGVDATPAMLAVAQAKVPGARFNVGTFDDLPVDDASIDLLTCSLALTHTPDLGSAMAEFARVLRPGGWALLSDLHPVTVLLGGTAVFQDADAPSGYLTLPHTPNLYHSFESYIRAIITAGLTITDCREIPMPEVGITGNPIYPLLPGAVRQAYEDTPFILIWHLTR